MYSLDSLVNVSNEAHLFGERRGIRRGTGVRNPQSLSFFSSTGRPVVARVATPQRSTATNLSLSSEISPSQRYATSLPPVRATLKSTHATLALSAAGSPLIQ